MILLLFVNLFKQVRALVDLLRRNIWDDSIRVTTLLVKFICHADLARLLQLIVAHLHIICCIRLL